MFLDVAGSSGRSQSHSGDCLMGAGTRGGLVTVGDAKGNREGRRNVSRQLLLLNFSTSATPNPPNWSDLPGNRRRGSEGSEVPGHSEKVTIRAENGR